MKKHIVITRVLEFGGSNTYLKTVIEYFGKENLIVILKSEGDFINFEKIDPQQSILVKVIPDLKEYVRFKKFSFLHNLKEILYILKTLSTIFCLSVRYKFSGITISVINPEMYLYLFWLPFIRVNYVLHSEPFKTNDFTTAFTCNSRLGNKKKIITVSNSNKKSVLIKWRIKEAPSKFVYVVYNCSTEIKKLGQNMLPNNDETQIVLTMGHVVEYKNPHLWLQVATQVTKLRSNIFFYWLGNGELLEYFQEQTKITGAINFIGLVNDPGSFLKKATIYYQPSLSETQGIAVIEAMSNHLPCVVSNVGGLPESIENNRNGFVVNAESVDENVNRIIELLDKRDLCKLFGKSSYERYNSLFSYDVFRREMDKLYI